MIARMPKPAQSVPQPVSIVSVDAGHCIATYEHVLLLCWREEVTVTSLKAARAAHFAMIKHHPGGVGCLTVRSGTRLGEAAIQEAAALVRETYRNVHWSACVVGGEGFVASATRAGLTSILSLAGQSSLVKVFRDLPTAVVWQERHESGRGVRAGALREAASAVEAAMLSHAAAS